MAEELLSLQKLSKYYISPTSVVVGLNGMTMSFCRGEFVAITGESGSGKSTMAHVLAGILPYESGELLYKGSPTSHYGAGDWEEYRRDKVSFISQSYGILPGNTVLSNVVSALRLVGMNQKTALVRAEEALKQVELWDLRRRRAAKLSSGQKQRLSIARALARPAPILIADEPTGNLDAENSAKVIELLAQAAKDRLVILITHEFSECADYATRHISLHDGNVTMDKALRGPYESDGQAQPVKRKLRKGLSFTVAGLQLRSRPVWVATMLTLFTLAFFTMFVQAGTFIANLDDRAARYYNNSAFLNGDPRRIVVGKLDGAELTGEDYAALAGVKYVESVEPWGYVTDYKYAWRGGMDYDLTTTLEGDSMSGYFTKTVCKLKPEVMSYVKTVPILPEGKKFLTTGRMPETPCEVVAAQGTAQIGDVLQVYFNDPKHWNKSLYAGMKVEVVGLTDAGGGLYFSEGVGRELTRQISTGLLVLPSKNSTHPEKYPKPETVGDPERMGVEPISERDLVAGRLPQSLDEIVIRGREELLGTTLTIICEDVLYGYRVEAKRDAAVVGLLDERGPDLLYLYYDQSDMFDKPGFIETFDKNVQARLESGMEQDVEASRKWYEMVREKLLDYTPTGEQTITVNIPVLNGEYLLPEKFGANLPNLLDQIAAEAEEDWKLTRTGFHEYTYGGVVVFAESTYEKLRYESGTEQASLTIEDYPYTDRVLEAVQELGYVAVSPYREGAGALIPNLAEQRMQTLRICLIAFLAALFLQVLVLRAMFSLENESYRLMSNIGLDRVTAKRSVFWQILSFTFGGQALGILAIALCGRFWMENVAHLLRYLDTPLRMGLILLHMAVCMFTSLWVMHALEKKVYPDPTPEPDLDWNDAGEEADT